MACQQNQWVFCFPSSCAFNQDQCFLSETRASFLLKPTCYTTGFFFQFIFLFLSSKNENIHLFFFSSSVNLLKPLKICSKLIVVRVLKTLCFYFAIFSAFENHILLNSLSYQPNNLLIYSMSLVRFVALIALMRWAAAPSGYYWFLQAWWIHHLPLPAFRVCSAAGARGSGVGPLELCAAPSRKVRPI